MEKEGKPHGKNPLQKEKSTIKENEREEDLMLGKNPSHKKEERSQVTSLTEISRTPKRSHKWIYLTLVKGLVKTSTTYSVVGQYPSMYQLYDVVHMNLNVFSPLMLN